MSKKYFIVFGLFLAAGFLFLNISAVKAETWTWTGGGDTHTWTDPQNWGMGAAHSSLTQYPGATSTVDVVIPSKARVIATTTLAASIGSLTLGDSDEGVILTVANKATIYASTTVTLLGTSTLAFGDNTANTAGGAALGLGAGNLYIGGYSGVTSTPLTIGAVATFTAGTSTITYAGQGNFYIATTTYYNLTLTPTSTEATRVYTIGNGGNATTTNVLTINQAAQLNLNAKTFELSGSGTPLVYTSDGSFVANNSRVVYSSTSATNIATTTYYILEISGAATKSLVGNTTVTSAVRINPTAILNGASTYNLTLSGSGTPLNRTSNGAGIFQNIATVTYNGTSATNIASGTYTNLVLGAATTYTTLGNITISTTATIPASATLAVDTGFTWTNSGTVTNSGKITLAGAGILSNSAGGSAVGSFGNADLYPTVHVEITDTSLNLVAATAETKTATVTSTSGITDSETVTLTETGVATGIFQGSIVFALSGSDVDGRLDYQGGGTVSYTWTDSQDTDDTETGSATFTGTTPGGGSSSSGATAVTTTTTVTPAPTTVATTVTPTVTAVSTLESVQSKVTSVIAKIAALPTNPTASDLSSIQAEIAAILLELQTIQAAQPTPQGVALGFNFVRPLALGLRHADVSNLQQALKTDSSVYPEGLVTGYFGSMTLKAVQKFQEKYGIASPGVPGYGNVGPATRAKLNELYGSK